LDHAVQPVSVFRCLLTLPVPPVNVGLRDARVQGTGARLARPLRVLLVSCSLDPWTMLRILHLRACADHLGHVEPTTALASSVSPSLSESMGCSYLVALANLPCRFY
jgi:hypothetical protein